MYRASLLLLTLTLTACGPQPRHNDTDFADASTSGTPDAAPPNLCGNGVVDPSETCDPPGSCMATGCDDLDPCTTDTLGSAATCDLRCGHASIDACTTGDLCCPHGCAQAADGDCSPFILDPYYSDDYWLVDLGPPVDLPVRFGPLMIAKDDPDTLLIGGTANQDTGALYAVPLNRNPEGHITGFAGPAVRIIDAAYNDGGMVYLPNGAIMLARWPVNQLGMTKPASVITDKIIDLAALTVTPSPGGLAVVPNGFLAAGQLKLVSWSGGEWYTLTLTDDGAGLYDVTTVTPHPAATLAGGPTGMAYVPPGSPKFMMPSVLVSEWTAGAVATYEVDDDGEPVLSTRKDFIPGLPGAIGAAIDPVTGDFMFSTFVFAGGDRVVIVRGFATPIIN